MGEILVSIVVPVYNLEKFIDRCLSSIENQTYNNIEIIVVDDGSTDLSYQIINKHLIKEHRMKYVKQENNGVSSARNRGIMIAKGKYITFIDGDDYVSPTMIESLLNTATNGNFDIVYCLFSTGLVVNNKKPLANNYIKSILVGEIQRSACGILFDLELIKRESLLFDKELTYGEDMLFSIHALLLTNKNVGLVSEKYYIVEERQGSAIRTMNLNHYDKIELLAFKLEEAFEKSGVKLKFKTLLEQYYLLDIVFSISHLVKSNASFNKKLEKLRLIKRKTHFKSSMKVNSVPSKLTKLKAMYIRFAPPAIIILSYSLKDRLNRFK